ncbi:hypothetical protein KAR48_18825 [bacterium]|nr:hypothetical protein [bacterium]
MLQYLHSVHWKFYRKAYAGLWPHIYNNCNFAEILSEISGELNGSHTRASTPPFPQ